MMTRFISDLREKNPNLDKKLAENSGRFNEKLINEVKEFVAMFYNIPKESIETHSWNSITHEFMVGYTVYLI